MIVFRKGTSYTLQLISRLSMTLTATNYGTENGRVTDDNHFKNVVQPVFPNQELPVWIMLPAHPEYTKPSHYVLTKTHCGGRCVQCPPHKYIETPYSFQQQCLRGNNIITTASIDKESVINDLNATNNQQSVIKNQLASVVSYPANNVKKAIHLIRDPFDNVVSRFHLERHGHSAQHFASSREGFRAFCEQLNHAYRVDEDISVSVDETMLLWARQIPCYAEFIRWIQWHNMAFIMAQEMSLQTYVLHYDWYSTRFNETIIGLLNFLHLDRRADPEPFLNGKVYHDYYDPHEMIMARNVIQALALSATWKHVEQYFVAAVFQSA
jgi:hypothetical protein